MNASNISISGNAIKADLEKLGLRTGDVLLVHASLRSIGYVDGGAKTVIDAILDVIGSTGSLFMPSFPAGSEHELLRNGLVFDLKTSPSRQGIIPETFRMMSGVLRSIHPSHCLAGCGLKAESILEGHENCNVSVGRGTPFEKIVRCGGKILLLGVSHDKNTTLHYVENVNGAPTLSRELFKPTVIDMDGIYHVVPTYPHMPGLKRCYGKVETELIKEGIQSNGKIGAALSSLVDASSMSEFIGKKIRETPAYLIDVFCP